METVTGFTSASFQTPRSSRHPGPGLVEVVHLVDAALTGHRPPEHPHRPRAHTHRLGDQCAAGDGGGALPGRSVSELAPEPGLHLLDPGAGLEAVEVRQHEEDPRLAGLDRLLQSGLEDLAVVIASELAR